MYSWNKSAWNAGKACRDVPPGRGFSANRDTFGLLHVPAQAFVDAEASSFHRKDFHSIKRIPKLENEELEGVAISISKSRLEMYIPANIKGRA